MMVCMRQIPVVVGSGVAEIFETVWSIQRGVMGELKPLSHPHSPFVGGAYPHWQNDQVEASEVHPLQKIIQEQLL